MIAPNTAFCALAGITRYLAVSGGIWRYLAVSGGIRRYLAVSGGIWRYLAVFGEYCAITPHYPPSIVPFNTHKSLLFIHCRIGGPNFLIPRDCVS